MKTVLFATLAILASSCGGAPCPLLEDPAMVARAEEVRASACASVALLPDICPAVGVAKQACEASASAYVVLTRLREAEAAVQTLRETEL